MTLNKVAIISDTHIGAKGYDKRIYETIHELRSSGYKIVFLGDIFDFVRNENANKYGEEEKKIFKKGDVYVNGNHDFFYSPPPFVWYKRFSYKFVSGGKRFYLAHGDAVDFVYTFKRLERHENPWYIKLLSYLGNWKTEHYQRLYRAMEMLPDKVVEAFEHPNVSEKINYFYWIQAFFKSMWQGYKEIPLPLHDESVKDEGPIVTFSIDRILKRQIWFDKTTRDADVLIIGHLHRPMYGITKYDGKQYEVLVNGAWVGNAPRAFILVEDGGVQFVSLS